MSTFQPLQPKRSLLSTPATPTSSLLQPSRPLVASSPPASEPVAPPIQEQLERAARLGHSFARIPLFPPATRSAEVNKTKQAGAIATMQRAASTSMSTQPEQSSHTASTDRQASFERATRLGHSFARIPLFPPTPPRAVSSPAVIQRVVYGDEVAAKFDAASPPTGDYPPEFYRGKFFGREFEIIADFKPDRVKKDDDKYFTGEYRQYIKGYFKSSKSGYMQVNLGGGAMLSKDKWKEDGYKDGTKYGYRNKPDTHGKYIDKGDGGSRYEASDIPSIPVDKDESIEMSLDFEGKLILTDEKSKPIKPIGNTELASRKWSMKGVCTRDKKGEETLGKLKQTGAEAKKEKGGKGKERSGPRKAVQTRGVGKAQEMLSRSGPIGEETENTGMPGNLKAGIEYLSGMAMDDVKVHYNSSRPAQVQALAYTRGTDIYLGRGQEKHLAHEAWHVVQQKQGRVRPKLEAKGIAINDDKELEREADAFGERVLARNVVQGVFNSPSAAFVKNT